MGNDLKRGIRVYLETSDYGKGMEQMSAATKKYEADLEKLTEQAQNMAASGKDTGKAWDDLQKQIKRTTDQVKKSQNTEADYAAKLKQTEKVLNNLSGSSYNELIEVQKKLQKEVKATTRDSDLHNIKLVQLERTTKEVGKAQLEMNSKLGASGNMFSKATGFVNKYWAVIGGGIAAITGISFTFRKLAEDVAKMDDVYSDVMKTTGLTRDQVLELNEAFKKMDTRTSREYLNKLASEAGKLGKEGSQNILDFVDAGNQIRVSLGEDLGEDAIKNIGKMVGVFDKSTKDLQGIGLKEQMLAVGSAINQLGASSSASEDYLVQFAGRLGGVASQAGISIDAILGFGSALDQDMQQVEMSATALQNFIMKIMGEPAKFAKIAGMNVKEFTTLLDTDANGAIKTVLRALNEKGGFQALIPTFQSMGLDGARAVGVLSAMASSIDKIDVAQKTANESLREGTSITNEYDIKNNNLAAKLDKAKKEFKEVSLELGESLNPALLKSTNATSYLIKGLVELPGWLKRNAVTLITLTTGIIAYTIAVNSSIIADKIKILWNDKLVKSFKYLWTVMSENPYAAIALGIALLVAGLIDYMRRLNSATELEKARMNIQKKVNEQYDEQASKIDILVGRIKNENLSNEQRRKAINDLKAIIPAYNGMISEEGKLINHNKAAIDAYLISLEKQIKLKATQDEWEELIRKKRQQQKDVDKYKTQQDNISGSLTTEYAQKYGGAAAMSAQSAAAQITRDANNATRALNQTNDALKTLEKELKNSDIPIIGGDNNKKNDLTSPTTPADKNKKKGDNPWDKEIKAAEEAYKLEKLLYSTMLKDKLISQEMYEIVSIQREINFMQNKKQILENYKQSSIDVQQDIINAQIRLDEKNKKIETPAVKALSFDKSILKQGLTAYLQNIEDKKKADEAFYKWKKSKKQKDLDDTIAVAQFAADAVSAYHQLEADNLEAEKQRELTAAGNNADAREQIEKEYAQKELDLKKKQANVDMAVNIGMAFANGAVAIMKAWADLGPIAGPVAAGLIGVTTLIQIASIKKQRDAIMATTLNSAGDSKAANPTGSRVVTQAAEGRWDVIGADDGRTYINVPYRGVARTGIVTGPTLMGERGDELIVDNPTLRNIRMNEPWLINRIKQYRVQQRAIGNYTAIDNGSSDGSYGSTATDNTALIETLNKVIAFLEYLIANGVKAPIVLSELEAKIALRDKSLKKGSLH